MRIRLIWVGKNREKYLAEGIERYMGSIRPFADISVVEIKEEGGRLTAASLLKEGRRILKSAQSYILMDETGREVSSRGLAAMVRDRASVDFVLGGAYGVSDEVKAGASDVISLSRMTFTHEMSRLILLEQIYRALMINTGRGYHH